MITFHRFLIGTAIVFCLGLSAWLVVTGRPGGDGGDGWQLALAGAFAVAAVVLGYYLKHLRRFLHP